MTRLPTLVATLAPFTTLAQPNHAPAPRAPKRRPYALVSSLSVRSLTQPPSEFAEETH